ncbi:hypothetical protein [Albibacillus kandeliae]|uniref:hypothetical protein n=1 Tax=Albibacillus kandeliae TaxID=2174228 RepID=UPI000D6917D7|nr:hypothetical protein [Albibacillus kandeliae]
MSKVWEKFQTDFKKMQPKLKAIKVSEGEKLRKQILTDLKKAWDLEDALREAVEAAKTNGVTGSKLADFMKDGDFSKAMTAWKKALADHKGSIAKLKEFHAKARDQYDELKHDCDAVIKDVKKAKQPPANKKEIDTTIKSAEKELSELEKALSVYGKLKAPELFYGAQEDRTAEVILKKEAKKSGGGGELPKVLDDKVSKKNLKLAENIDNKIAELCKSAEDQAKTDPRKSKAAMKLAEKELAKLKKLHDSYAEAAKKQAKEIAAAPNKKELEKVIKAIGDHYAMCADSVKHVSKEIA